MSNYKTFETIKKDHAKGNYVSHMKIPEKVSLDHIFDSTLSAEKNREMALVHNENVEILKKVKENEDRMLYEKLAKDVTNCLARQHKLTKDESERLEAYMKDDFGDLPEFIAENSVEFINEYFIDLIVHITWYY